MARRNVLLVALLLVALLAVYLAYDWTRPCVGGPVRQLLTAIANGGSYTARCAG